MKSRRNEGRVALGLLALLLILVGGGGVNYHRNLTSEQASAKTRPFHAYDRSDLDSLRSAYASEAAAYQARYQAQRDARERTGPSAMMGENIRSFERTQGRSSDLRDLTAEVAEREARLREIDSEIAFRNELGEGWEVHLNRLTKI